MTVHRAGQFSLALRFARPVFPGPAGCFIQLLRRWGESIPFSQIVGFCPGPSARIRSVATAGCWGSPSRSARALRLPVATFFLVPLLMLVSMVGGVN